MPIYQYKCNKCGNMFERISLVIRDEKNDICPECKSDDVSKVLFPGSTHFVIKGYSSKNNYSSDKCKNCSDRICDSGK